MELRKAARQQAKLRIGLEGPSGSGKTLSALLIASGMADWSKIALIDTENGSGELYAKGKIGGHQVGEYNVIPLGAPYTPERYIEALRECERAGMEVVIIDSISHEWEGKGGLLESNELVAQTKFRGNTWAAWSVTTPRHQAFIAAVLASKCHVITTARSKVETAQVDGGKVKKIGIKAITREGFDYEVTVNFSLDKDGNYAVADKDRTDLFMGADPFKITPTTGKKLLAWSQEGVPPIVEEEPLGVPVRADVQAAKAYVKASMGELPDEGWGKVNYQTKFLETFEILAKVKKWKKKTKDDNLNSLLSGRELLGISDEVLKKYIEMLNQKIQETKK